MKGLNISGKFQVRSSAINSFSSLFDGAYKFPFYPDNRIKKNPDGSIEISPKFPDPNPPLSVPPGGKVVEMAEETQFSSSSATAFIPNSNDTYTITETAKVTLTWIAADGMVRFTSVGLVVRTYGEPFSANSYTHPSFYTSYVNGSIPYYYPRSYSESYSVIFYNNEFRRFPGGNGSRSGGYNYSFSVSGGCTFS
jgi:hypothetical protein